MASLKVWSPEAWKDAAQGPALVQVFAGLGYDSVALEQIKEGYKADGKTNLSTMQAALQCTQLSSDLNYVWTSDGQMGLMMEEGKNDAKQIPEAYDSFAGLLNYDGSLRAWVAKLESMHASLMTELRTKVEGEAESRGDWEADMEKFDVSNMCEGALWANGISVSPPKFDLVTQMVKKYFPDVFLAADKMLFWRRPDANAPPFAQIKVHQNCLLFKGREGPGSTFVNPEFSQPGHNKLRTDLPERVFTSKVFTVEVIGGKTSVYPQGLAGKLSYEAEEVVVIPMVPGQTKKFDPFAEDWEDDVTNSHAVFRNSHPTIE